MKSVKNTSVLKMVTISLGIALLCSIAYTYKVYVDFSKNEKTLNDEKQTLIKDLSRSKDSLEIAITENSSLKTELIIERQKVTNLLNEINNTNFDLATVIKYRTEASRLKEIVARLTKEKAQLKLNYELVKIQRDSTILVLNNAKEYKKTLGEINEEPIYGAKKAVKLSVINLKTTPFRQSGKGELLATDKAKNVDVLKISFTVVGSKISNPFDKQYYIQIIDSKNNIVGARKTKRFGEMILNYSYETSVKFKNESIEVSNELVLNNVEKGNYFVNVFDKNELASKTTFALR